MLTLKWVPTADNDIADAISRPARESLIRLKPLAFQELWGALGPFTFDLMACTESAQKVPGSHDRLPFFFAVRRQRSVVDGRAGARCIAIAGQGRSNVRLLLSPPP